MRQWMWIFALAGICGLFLAILCHYGCDFHPCSPDETVFLQPAQNLAEGKGMGTPLLDDLLPGISQKTYWQPPVYFLTLSAWGSLFGFDLISARWLSRILGTLGLVMLFAISRHWGLPFGISLFCVLWTALDYRYQISANIARMDILNFVFLLASVMAFTKGMNRQSNSAFLLSGFFGILSVLTHLISVPVILVLLVYLLTQRLWKQAFYFVLPLLFGLLAWLVYALQDWSSFWGQMSLQFQRKGEFFPFVVYRLFLPLLSPLSLRSVWLVLAFATIVALKFKHSPLLNWQAFVIGTMCLTEIVGVEIWYEGWFIPWGYLMAGAWGNAVLKWQRLSNQWQMKQKLQMALIVIALLLAGYGAAKTWQISTIVPTTRSDTAKFVDELVRFLPKNATVLMFNTPDPCPILIQLRPDLRIYQLSPTPMRKEALERIAEQSDFFIGSLDSVKKLEVPYFIVRAWTIRAPFSPYRPCLFLLSKLPLEPKQ